MAHGRSKLTRRLPLASIFESYAGCCQLKDIEAFLVLHGFREVSRHKFAQRAQGGGYYDVVYQRQP